MKTLIAGLLLTASLAAAQPKPAADVEQLWLDPAARGSLFVGNGQTLKVTEFRVGVAAFYTQGNLRSLDGQSTTELIADRFGFQVFGAFGVLDWLELSANVPVIASQSGAQRLGLASGGLGNPWVHAKVRLLGAERPVSLAIALGVGLPLGTAAAQGDGGLSAMPRIQLGRVFDAWQFGLELGYLHRTAVSYAPVTGRAGDRLGSQLFVGGQVAAINPSGPRGELSVRAFVPLEGGAPGVEGQIGVRWLTGPVELVASVGPGFGGQLSTPSVRAYLGVAFANAPLTQPPCVEGTPYAVESCPALDRDGDGVKNGVDGAPLEPEDVDGFRDEDGVPDPDNDGDGVLDGDDGCPDVAGPVANRGCPDVDTDGDGIVDRLDRCVDQPEDQDDFEDADGCPDLDNDADGVLDRKDACPNQPGIRAEKGCPAKDSDGDGVFDHEDNCPQEPGVKQNAGCPPAKKQKVLITPERIEILELVFFDTGKANIQKRSNGLLDNVAEVLAAHPELLLIQIEGHTDNVGQPATNKTLSQARAEAVRAYLVKQGVAEARLRAAGFGEERPAAPNDTPAGRETNRRVEFNLADE